MPGAGDGLHPGWVWLGASVALAVLATNVAWAARHATLGPLADARARLRALPGAPIVYQASRLAYYVGLPFAALLFGHDVVSERYLGLQRLLLPSEASVPSAAAVSENWADWARDTGWAAAMGIAAFLLLLLTWWTYRRALRAADLHEKAPFERPSGWVKFREAAFHETHWAFYRSAPLMALRPEPGDVYWGVWLGLGIAGLEATLNPAWRRELSVPEGAPPALLRVALALLSALMFWRTQNGWLALGLHALISWAMGAVAATTTGAPN